MALCQSFCFIHSTMKCSLSSIGLFLLCACSPLAASEDLPTSPRIEKKDGTKSAPKGKIYFTNTLSCTAVIFASVLVHFLWYFMKCSKENPFYKVSDFPFYTFYVFFGKDPDPVHVFLCAPIALLSPLCVSAISYRVHWISESDTTAWLEARFPAMMAYLKLFFNFAKIGAHTNISS